MGSRPKKNTLRWAAIIVAAGKSTRLKSRVPKPFIVLKGRKTLLDFCLKSFRKVPGLTQVIIVTQKDYLERAVESLNLWKLSGMAVEGGKEREDSVLKGLLAASPGVSLVLVHDAARPLVRPEVIRRVLKAAAGWGAAIPVVPVSDTLKVISKGKVVKTLDRTSVGSVQTPQGFKTALLKQAFLKVGSRGSRLTDDAAIAEAAGYTVRVVEGDPLNFKVTTLEDFQRARNIVQQAGKRG
jgi:2-C-methyl-D-erythritol 4-phosphate cytidylyltransferase